VGAGCFGRCPCRCHVPVDFSADLRQGRKVMGRLDAVERVDGYEVPVDPADALDCDSCQ